MAQKSASQKNLKSSSSKSAAAKPKRPKDVKPAKSVKPVKDAKKKAPKKEPKKETKPIAKTPPPAKDPPKKKRSKSNVVRLKAFWGVFNQMMKRVQVFEYAERRQADKKAAELSVSAKSPHFVQLVKEVIRDAE